MFSFKTARVSISPINHRYPRMDCQQEELQSNGAVEFEVVGLVDYTHASVAQVFEDIIAGTNLADHGEPTRGCMIPTARRTSDTAIS